MVIWTKTLDRELDYYYGLAPDTYIYVFKLKFNGGIRLIKEASNRADIKVYCGNVKRKTTKQAWFQHFTVGKGAPDIIYIRLSNGVRIYDYSKFDPSDDPDPAEALELCEMLVSRFDAPYSPTKIIRAAIPLLNKVQGKNQYGVQVKQPTEELRRFARHSFYGGAVANINRNGGYKIVPHETHVDYHQMYASIMYTQQFPDIDSDYTIEKGYVEHPMAIYWIGGGRIKLKKDGFPLLSIDKFGDPNKDIETEFKKYRTIPWDFLTKMDLDLVLENFDVDQNSPIEIVETFYYNKYVSGKQLFGRFIETIYIERNRTSGATKRFYKLLNEYLPGSFERCMESSSLWEDLQGPQDQKGKVSFFNNIIGTFITAYGRQELAKLIRLFRPSTVIGYDTDCVFFKGTPEEVPAAVVELMGDGMGQLHFDGIYTDVRHLAPKQYYGYEDGEIFAKMAGVKNSLEVATNLLESGDDTIRVPAESLTYMWDRKKQEFIEEYIPSKVSWARFKDNKKGGLFTEWRNEKPSNINLKQ